MKPKEVNILGKVYSIEYLDNPSDVDLLKRESLWGSIDFWTRTIRVYDGDRTTEDVWDSIIHEVIHGISSELKLVLDKSEYHDDLSILAIALTDVLLRNKWIVK